MKKILRRLSVFLVVLSGFVVLNTIKAETKTSGLDVDIRATFDEYNDDVLFPFLDLEYNAEITVNTGIYEGYEFAFWVVDGVIRGDLISPQQTFHARNNLTAIAVYHPVDKHAVLFVDHSGKFIETKYINSGEIVSEPAVLPDKVGYKYANPKWVNLIGSSSIEDNITENTVFKLQYERITDETFTINLTNATEPSITANYNDIVTVTSNLVGFTHWEENGKVVSYNNEYKFSALFNRILVAKTGRTRTPLVTLGNDLKLRTGYVSRVAQVDIPNEYELLEYGYLISKTEGVLTIENATIANSSAMVETTKEYLTTFKDTYTNIRAYAIIKNNGNIEHIYSELDKEEQIIYETGFEASEGFQSSTSYNNQDEKAFGPINEQWMTYYGTASTTSAIAGIQSMQMRWYTSAPENTGYVRTNFLLENITKIDFKAENTAGLNVKVQISTDKTNWIDLETITLSTSATSYSVLVPEEHQDKSVYIKFAMILPDPVPTGTSRIYIDDVIIYGLVEPLIYHEVTFDSNGGSPVSSEQVKDGDILILPEDPTKDGFNFMGWFIDVELTFPFVVSNQVTAPITLYAKWEERQVQTEFIEDFTNSNATASYSNGSFVGNNGITWSYEASRDGNGDDNNSGINLPALMLRRNDKGDNSHIISSTIPGGISSFSVKLYKGFTGGGDRQVELFINGVSRGTSTPFNDFNEHIFEVNDINIIGDITIEIRNITSKQVIIDDITWTSYGSSSWLELISIQDARINSNGSKVKTQGIITSSVLNNNIYYAFMQDNNSGIYIESLKHLTVGEEVVIKAFKQTVNGVVTLVDIEEVTVLTTKTFNITQIKLNELNNNLGKYVEVTGFLTSSTMSNQTIYEIASIDGLVNIELPSYINQTTLQSLLNGKEKGIKVKLEGFVYKGNVIYLINEVGLYIEDIINNEEVSAVILADLNMPVNNQEVTSDIDLPVTDNKFNSTIEWLSSDNSVLSDTGKITLPNIDTQVTLYYEIKLGINIIKSSSINVLVLSKPPLLPYYDSVNGLKGNDLFIGLRSLISNRIDTSYDYAKTILENSDRDPNNSSNVLLIYNRASVQGPWSTNGTIWNREHVWPQSFLDGADDSDVHNLRPANLSINSSRGNKNFARGSGSYGAVSGGWYPGDDDRGDVARIMFYMITLYSQLTISTMGSLEMFIEWHNIDPVDDFERNRNEVIYTYTNNRNPYIDNPQFVSEIWGSTTSLSLQEKMIYQEVFPYKINNLYLEKRIYLS